MILVSLIFLFVCLFGAYAYGAATYLSLRRSTSLWGMRHRQRADEKTRHPGEQQHTARRGDGTRGVRQPCVAAEHPREHTELDRGVTDPGRIGMMDDDFRNLGDREHKDQIKKQFEGGDAIGNVGM